MNSKTTVLTLLAGFTLLIWYFIQPIKTTVSNTAKAVLNTDKMNNPFNIRNLKKKNGQPVNAWLGLIESENPFCKFISIQYGIRAMIIIYNNNLKGGVNTIEKLISKFAPPSENDTAGYIQFISAKTGLHSSKHILTTADRENVLRAMAKMENNYTLDPLIYAEAVKLV